mgnify:CR=1 FL=1
MTLRLAVAVLTSLLFAPAALAGTVDVAMEAGTVTVTGSDTADVVTLATTDQGILVTPGPGTGSRRGKPGFSTRMRGNLQNMVN